MEDNEEEGLKILEDGLKAEITELKSQIEENELIHGIPSKGMSSIYVPKDPDHFRRLRRLCLQRTMEVTEERPLKIQADFMKEELETCDRREYTAKSIPLLLHQYFIDKMQECVVAKHAHLLRWKRYCVTTAISEAIYPEYKERLQHIMNEYMDASSRAHRLAAVQEGYLNGTDYGIDEVSTDDLLIFLRWLICHLHSLKYMTQILRIIQWIPMVHRKDIQDIVNLDIEKIVADYGSQEADQKLVSFEDEAPMPPAALVAAMFVSVKPLTPSDFHMGLAAAGGGMVTNEKYLNIPLHTNDLNALLPHLIIMCHTYNIEMDVARIQSSADEMELFGHVNRKFRNYFVVQEQERLFRAYEAPEAVAEKWGTESHSRTVLKPSNWLSYVRLKPRNRHLVVVRYMASLRSKNQVDELLRAADRFLSITHLERVQDALRHHALMVQHPPVVHNAAVIANRQGISISEIFKKIYTNQELYNTKPKKSGGKSSAEEGNRINPTQQDTYEFAQTMQMLGLDEQTDNKDDPSSVQGAYLSYLHLRHLKIRDLQRTCMSILNYFRSVERTITINDQGLSLDGVGERSNQNHRVGSIPGHQGGGGNIGSHGYLFNTPREFKISETEFMQFAEVENHDDFYFTLEGRIHIRDQVGNWIMYDVAVSDFEQLRQDLLLISSAYISKDKELRSASLFSRKKQHREDSQDDACNSSSDFDIREYAHQEVDRFGVLYDVWSNHTKFLECKQKLIDILMEVYLNTFNREERRLLAQEITNMIWRHPRLDLEANYFVATYRLECAILRLRIDFLRSLLNTQIEQQREYISMIGDQIQDFGLPLPVIPKLPIAVNTDESMLKNIYFLEFHPSLSIVSHISTALDWCAKQLTLEARPTTISGAVLLEKKMMELLHTELINMIQLGTSYTPQAQRDLFGSYFIENPLMVSQLAGEDYLRLIDSRNTRGDKRSRKIRLLDEFGRLYEAITVRWRLIDATWESEVLAKVYQHQASALGYDDFHLFMRPIQFEAAKKKEGAETAKPPLYASSVQDDDTMLDKFTPSALPLAINEIDEGGMGKFSFKGRTQLLEMMEGRGIDNLLIVLKSQLTHKNALAAAVSLCNVCRPTLYMPFFTDNPVLDPTGTEVTTISKESEPAAAQVPISAQAGPTPLALDAKRADDFQKKDMHPEAFFSIQLEKTPSRDRAINVFVKKFGKNTPTSQEAEKVKRDLAHLYMADFMERVQQASLRAQIIGHVNSIRHLLQLVPEVARKFFQFGESFEKKEASLDDLPNTKTDPRHLRRRARRILSADGTKFLNLWFLPHFTEVLFLYKTMDDPAAATQALMHLTRIICSFHDILSFLVGFSRLQVSSAKVSTEMKQGRFNQAAADSKPNSSKSVENKKSNPSLASQTVEGLEVQRNCDYDGGVMSKMSTDLIEIEKQILDLPNPADVDSVVNLLKTRRNVAFLKFEYCVRHVLLETLLSSENEDAYKALVNNMNEALEDLTNVQVPCVHAVCLNVPEPMEARDPKAVQVYPFRSYLNRGGPFWILLDLQKNIEENIQLCLAGLNDVDRPIVHGEFVALDLCLEDLLSTGDMPESKAGEPVDILDYESVVVLGKKFQKKDPLKQRGAAAAAAAAANAEALNNTDTSLSKTTSKAVMEPSDNYHLIRKYLIVCKRLDLLKYNWGARKLGLEVIETSADFKMFCKIYKTDKLYPLIKSLCIQYRMPELAEQGPFANTDIFVTPKGIPDMVVRQRQLGKMIETFESTMIGELRKRIVRQIDLVVKERNREEGNLPLDLWKKPAMKEAISVKRPTIAEEFVQNLFINTEFDPPSTSQNSEVEEITMSRNHINTCLQNLAISVLNAEKESYENYAMYYENQLKQQHQLLYSRERDLADLRQQLQLKEQATNVSVQFQLADQAHSLLLEVNALRAKVSEMREDSLQQDQMIREEVRQEYNSMVRNLFSVAFEQKNQIDVYREYLHDATLQRIQEVRTEAAIEMNKVKEKSGAKASTDDELAERNLKLSRELTSLQQDNIHVRQMMSRMRSVFNWHHTFLRCNFQKALAELSEERDLYKSNVTNIQMSSDQKIQLLAEELQRMKQFLTGTERELNELRKTLDKEMKDKLDKKQASERKAATDKQMALVKQMHIDQLMSEITEKNGRIAGMSHALSENIRSHKSVTDKSARELGQLRKTLREERKLKQSAFGKVDDLVTQVYEFEAAFSLLNAGPLEVGVKKRYMSGSGTDSPDCSQVARTSRPNTSLSGSKKIQPVPPVGGSTMSTRPRPVTYGDILRRYPMPYTPGHLQEFRRDKVTGHSLRRRIADQLLMNLEPEDHEQLTSKATNSAVTAGAGSDHVPRAGSEPITNEPPSLN